MTQINFYALFAGLLIVLGAEPFLAGMRNGGALIQLAFSSILVVGVFSLAPNRPVFYLGVALAIVTLASGVGYLNTGWAALRVIDLLAIMSFCGLAVAATVRQVLFAPGAVTLNRIIGALCIYLLLGVLWAALFAVVELADPDAFSYANAAASDTVEHFLYYSFVTLTTLGYGDISPVHPVARTLAYLEAVTGQLYVAVLIAGLVSRHIADLGSSADA